VNSGSVFEIDELTYDLLEHYPDWDKALEAWCSKYTVEDMKESWDELKELEAQGVLYAPDMVLEDRFTTGHPIKAMCLHVSHDCNMRCAYCFASEGSFHGEKVLMDAETGKKALDFLIANSGNRRHLEVDFFGGEPLMNLDVVKELVDYARGKEKALGKEFRFTMTTNGLLLNEENMAYLNDTMVNIVLSLDGRQETNDRMRKTVSMDGTYDHIIDKIKRMSHIRGNKDHYVRGTFTRENLDFSKDVMDMVDQGFETISVEPVVAAPEESYALRNEDVDVLSKEYELLAVEYLKRQAEGKPFRFFHFNIDLEGGPCAYKRVSGCGAGTDYISITPSGDIYPCHQFVGLEEFKLGDLRQGIVADQIRKDFEKVNLTQKPACRDCWAKYYCGGGCFANAYNFNKDISVPYELGCILEKKRVECAIMIKIAQENL
jgi:uncharacterized protein